MTANIYVGVDKMKMNASDAFGVLGVFQCANDGIAIRDNLIPLIKIVHVEQDVGIYHVGTIDLHTLAITLCEPREVDHSAYKMPETVTRNEKITDSLDSSM